VISRLKGTLLTKDPDGTLELETAGGVVYEVDVPLTVLQKIPMPGATLELRTMQIVREDSVTLYGFLEPIERELFRRVLGAHGVGARLALQMLSAYTARRLARAIVEKDVAALKQISGVGKKTAETIILELSDKLTDLAVDVPEGAGESSKGAQEAVSALVALGYTFPDADDAVRAVLENGGAGTVEEIIRRALASR
jgi:Holliday junction DNA helicase RuvA